MSICVRCKKPQSKATALIRTKMVCPRCYIELKDDNAKRIKRGMAITNSLDLLEC